MKNSSKVIIKTAKIGSLSEYHNYDDNLLEFDLLKTIDCICIDDRVIGLDNREEYRILSRRPNGQVDYSELENLRNGEVVAIQVFDKDFKNMSLLLKLYKQHQAESIYSDWMNSLENDKQITKVKRKED